MRSSQRNLGYLIRRKGDIVEISSLCITTLKEIAVRRVLVSFAGSDRTWGNSFKLH